MNQQQRNNLDIYTYTIRQCVMRVDSTLEQQQQQQHQQFIVTTTHLSS